jgi:hypothetical protein
MIREFFVPRFAVIFFIMFLLLSSMIWIWGTAFPRERRRWLRGIKVPLVAALVSIICTVCLAVVLNYWK